MRMMRGSRTRGSGMARRTRTRRRRRRMTRGEDKVGEKKTVEGEEKFTSSMVALLTLSRGTGASFGHRPIDMLPREQEDLIEVLDWALEQPW